MWKDLSWLTKEHFKILAIPHVAWTIPAFVFAFGNSFAQLVISRLIPSSIEAGFVIRIRMVAQWFPKNMVRRAEVFFAG